MDTEKLFLCDQCFYASPFDFALQRHKKSHELQPEQHLACSVHEPYFYKCPDCWYSTYFKINISRHITKSHDFDHLVHGYHVKEFICTRCQYSTYSRLLLATHFETEAALSRKMFRFDCLQKSTQIDSWLECELCLFNTTHMGYFKRHLRRHMCKKNVFTCDKCQFKGENRISFENHLKNHLSEEKSMKVFKCTNCNYNSASLSELREHLILHPIQKQEWFNCSQCNYAAKTKTILQQHMFYKHAGTKLKVSQSLKCGTCFVVFKTQQSLEVHLRNTHLHLGWLRCGKCHFTTKLEQDLKYHEENNLCNSEETLWFQCENCPFKTSYEKSFKLHNKKCLKILQ